MSRYEAVFWVLLAGPSVAVYLLGHPQAAPMLGNLSDPVAFMAVTLCPLVGALLFEKNESLILSLLIPFAVTFAKALNFDGEERLVVSGFLVFLVASVVFWLSGCAAKYLYVSYFPNHPTPALIRKVLVVVAGCAVLLLAALFGRAAYRDAHYWQYDDYRWTCDSAPEDCCIRGSDLSRIPNDLPALLRAVNRSPDDPESFRAPAGDESPWNYPPKVTIVGVRGETADIEVINGFTLTQSMGTTGAAQFIAATVLTLTESPGIRYINLIFEEGDHAQPGIDSSDTLRPSWRIGR